MKGHTDMVLEAARYETENKLSTNLIYNEMLGLEKQDSGHGQVPTSPLQLLHLYRQPNQRLRNREEWTKGLDM
jgi:hypothetical protein